MAAAIGMGDEANARSNAYSSCQTSAIAARLRVRSRGTSRPAENIPGAPERTSARAPSRGAPTTASLSAAISCGERALAGGWLSRSSRTAPWSSVMIVGAVIFASMTMASPTCILMQEFEYPLHAFAELLDRCDQAHDEISVTGKIVEVAGMHEHGELAQEFNRQFLIGLRCRNAQHGIPPALDVQPSTSLLFCQLVIKLFEIAAQTVQERRLSAFALLYQHRRGQIDGEVQREKTMREQHL